LCPAVAGFLSVKVTVLGDTIKGTFCRYIATNIMENLSISIAVPKLFEIKF
jgi:hypothetical protein